MVRMDRRRWSADPPAAAQLEALAVTLRDALAEDAFYVAMERASGDGDAGRRGLLRYLEYSMEEAAEFGELLLPEADGDAAVGADDWGAAVWSRPLDPARSAEKTRRKLAFISETMGSRCLEVYGAIVGFMSSRSEGKIDADAWYLSILGVAPALQGRGLGVRLVAPVLADADAAGVATYLETFTPRNRSFYRRLGYREVGRFDEPTTGSPYWLMVRPAASGR
ncbi:MAG: GNAT family N-acetyltransferase [Acidobacteriota bacterium]